MNKLKWTIVGITLLLANYAYAAEFNGQCTTSLSQGAMFKTNCDIKELYQGKTYCFGSEASRAAFLQDPDTTIMKAREMFTKNAEPEREKMTQEEALKRIASTPCDLSNRDLGYLELDGKDLRHCNMVNTSFFGAYLRGANLSGANLQKSYLNLARLENADLSNANLTDATIFQAIFDKTNFKGANLTNARMIGTLGNVDMSGAQIGKGRFGLDIGNQPMGAMRFDAEGGKFAGSNFESADINRANVKYADFRGANLRNTDLFRADLSKADLTDADITGANLNEAVLDGTIMTGVKGLEAIKGYDMAKGQCIDCKINTAVAQPANTTTQTADADYSTVLCRITHKQK